MRNFWTKIAGKIKSHILVAVFFFSKIVPYKRYSLKILYSQTFQRRPYGAHALHAG